jgi:glycosyltransferase involved in cell wall biosynthesis
VLDLTVEWITGAMPSYLTISCVRSMKVLHVTQGYAPARGGTELLIQRVSEELVRQFGDEVTVFTTDCYNGEGFFTPDAPRLPAGWEELNGVRVRRFPVMREVSRMAKRIERPLFEFSIPFNQYVRALAGGPVVRGLTRAIREAPADVIAASSFPLLHMFSALRAAEQSHRPCVLHGGLHPEDIWGFRRSMIFRAIPRADYIANTGFEAGYVVETGASPDRVTTIGVGVDAERFGRMPAAEAKARLGLKAGPVVGFIGQLAAAKGVGTLVRAMPRVWQSEPDAQLLIAGGRTSYVPSLEQQIAALPGELRDRVTLRIDFDEDLKGTLFDAIDLLAYPSGYESFGIAFLEAWAAGKPVIGCRRGAQLSVVADGVDGLLVHFDDPPMLALAIVHLLANPAMRASYGEAGRRKVLERYTWPHVARQFREVYERAVRRARLAAAATEPQVTRA